MNNTVEDFVEKAKWVVRIVAKRRWLALGVAAGAAIVSGMGIMTVPDRYQASARIYVDTQTVLRPLMAGLVYQPNIDEQVRMLARTLISQPNVETLVRIPELELDVASSSDRDAVVSRLMKQIKLLPTGSGNLYEITYRGESPRSAQRLVEATVNLFVHANAGAKRRDSQDAGVFIADQIHTYEAKLVAAENRLKEFKIRNFGVSGVSNQDYFARMSALSEQVGKLRIDLNAATQARDTYRRELAAEDPLLPVEPSTTAAPVSEVEKRLEAQRSRLDELLRLYTDAHPDVINARRVVRELEVEARDHKEAEARALARSGKTGKAATSPVYQQLRISLAESEANVASLHSQLATQQGRLEQVRALASRVPQVEAELAQLNRDYDIIRKNYDEMVARRESASLGVKLDESAQIAEFRIVDPPYVAPSPVFPARLHLAIAAVVVSLMVGIGVAVIADLIWPTFDDTTSLQLLSARPVLGSVSMLVTPQGKHRQRMAALGFSAAFGVLLALQAAWVAWIAVQPNLE